MQNSFINAQQNEFLPQSEINSQINKFRSASADQIISRLQQKNTTLKSQVNKIQHALSQMKIQEKPRYGIILPQIKQDAIKKELQNAYKQINIYEHQIQKRRANTFTGQSAYVEQVNRIQKLWKEKVQLHERLKRQCITLRHESKQITKQLKNNAKKMEYEILESKLTTDIKYMKEKVREYENRRAVQVGQLQKQRLIIKEMQNQFLKQNPSQALLMIKNKIFRSSDLSQGNFAQSRSITQIQNETAKQESRVSQKSSLEDTMQKSPQTYAGLLNDARLFKKIQLSYQNKISLIVKERDQTAERNFASRNRILQVQYVKFSFLSQEIQTIQNNIAELKKLIDPALFKPKVIKNDQKVKQIQKIKGLTISHPFKFVQWGQITKNGKRFSDRAIIGKKKSKIVGIALYKKEDTQEFVGLQATYQLYDQQTITKKGALNMRQELKKQHVKQESFMLEGQDYIKTIELSITNKKIVGISLLTVANKILKCGTFSSERKSLFMKESDHPMCFYGSTLTDGFQCLGVEIFQSSESKENQQS